MLRAISAMKTRSGLGDIERMILLAGTIPIQTARRAQNWSLRRFAIPISTQSIQGALESRLPVPERVTSLAAAIGPVINLFLTSLGHSLTTNHALYGVLAPSGRGSSS